MAGPTRDQLFIDLGDMRASKDADLCRNLWVTQFLGVITVQQWADFMLWERLLNKHPELRHLVELGSLRGGLSLYLYLQCIQRGMGFDTFDLVLPQAILTPLGGRLGMVECCHAGDLWSDYMQGVLRGIFGSRTGPLLFFCDNGDKKREMRHFAPMLRPGDIMGVHDWGVEFKEEDIKPIEGLVRPVMHTDAEAVGAVTRFWERV